MNGIGYWTAWLMLGSAAFAAPPAPTAQLFLAPSGEPFRAAAGQAYPIASWFAGADRDHDGKLTQTEFTIDFARFFTALDANHDGHLGADEIRHYEDQLVPEVKDLSVGLPGGLALQAPRRAPRGHGFGQDYPGGGSPGGDDGQSQAPAPQAEIERPGPRAAPTGGGKYGVLAIPEPVKAMDSNFDGQVSYDEMVAAAARRFHLLDGDELGYLTLDRLPYTWIQHPPKHRR